MQNIKNGPLSPQTGEGAKQRAAPGQSPLPLAGGKGGGTRRCGWITSFVQRKRWIGRANKRTVKESG